LSASADKPLQLEGLADGAAIVRAAFAHALRPPPDELVWQWADKHRKLSSKSSAEEGQYRTSRFPFLREVMEAMSPSSSVDTIVVVKSSQMGVTEASLNLIGYGIARAPCAIALVMPNDDLAKDTKRTRIDPMIELSPELRARVADPRKTRDAGNTIALLEFPGGNLRLRGANSPAALKSWTAKWLILDEVDAYPDSAGEEGNPRMLAERATLSYQGRRKLVLISTPTIEGSSRICQEWKDTDQSFRHVPCPRCGDLSPMAWSTATRFVVGARKFVKWNDDATLEADLDVHIKCQACGGRIEDWEREQMDAEGVWVPQHPELSARTRGFHISRLYAPVGMGTLLDLVRNFRKARREGDSSLCVFFNRDLGEPWYLKGERPEWKRLYDLREQYRIGTVPRGGLVVVAAADVQGDRIEVAIDAYGEDMEYWAVDYRVLLGEPAAPEVWIELERLMQQVYLHEDGAPMTIRALAIDTGFATSDVYSWVRRQSRSRVFAVKGDDDRTRVLVAAPQKVEVNHNGRRLKRGLMLWHVGGAVAKAEIYGKLRLEKPIDGQPFPPGYRHYPQFGEEHFRQLTAEELRPVPGPNGRTVYRWNKVHERNEVLDCAVYSRAVTHILGLDRMRPEDWSALRGALGSPARVHGRATVERPAPPRPQSPPPAQRPQPPQPPRGFIGGGGGGSGWLGR
jgi:phage terminase large subunit GpA-like protein